MVITIDGPAGSGKSTAARKLATALGIAFLDTGATYRAVTLRALRAGDDLTRSNVLLHHAREMDLELVLHGERLQVLLDGQDVSDAIRTEEVSRNARYAANAPAVRTVLVELQRKIGNQLGSFVTEGRDQGTVVFPNADLKFYLDASPEQRARRRCKELNQRGQDAEYDEVLQSIRDRDASDSGRSVGPLTIPADALRIDTTNCDIEKVLQILLDYVSAQTGLENPL